MKGRSTIWRIGFAKSTAESTSTEEKESPFEMQASSHAQRNSPLLTVTGVHRSFQVGGERLEVLKGIEMELKPLQLVMLKGRSGSGKTTL